jgi:hypothetical protein
VKAFDQQGISLRGKMIADTPQKLYIVASNMTTQKPTLLTGQVPILDAIKCSCCLPFVFRPQVLFHQVYLDGGLFLDNIESIVPNDTLVFHIGPMSETIFEKDLDTMPMSTYAYKLYRAMRNTHIGPNVVWLQNDTIGLLHDLKPEDKKALYESGYSTAFRFLTKLSASGSQILFVGTKRQAKDTIETEARRCGMPFGSERWLGGTLTNHRTIRDRLKRLAELEAMWLPSYENPAKVDLVAYIKTMQYAGYAISGACRYIN